MKEVEILVEVFDKKDKVLEILKKFEFKGSKKITDIYFLNPFTKDLKIINNKCPRKWFRVRKKEDKCLFCFKEDVYKKDKWLYSNEYETEAKDFDALVKIIEKLGFKELLTINNLKHTFETKDYEIVFEEVKDLGLFLEVEKLDVKDHENIDKIKEEMQKFIDSLGIKVSKELDMGKAELLIKKKKIIL
jgi:predicted adenylyl cyclase CyaB